MTAIKPSPKLTQSRQAAAAGLLALARKEISADDLKELARDANSESKKAHASIKASSAVKV